MSRNDEPIELTAEERAFVARLREGYAPEPLAGARATAFNARLEERFERSRPSRGWFPLGVLAASAAALALALLVGTSGETVLPLPRVTPDPVGTQTVASAQVPSETATGATLLAYAMLDEETDGGMDEELGYLPDDYLILASLLDDGMEDVDAES